MVELSIGFSDTFELEAIPVTSIDTVQLPVLKLEAIETSIQIKGTCTKYLLDRQCVLTWLVNGVPFSGETINGIFKKESENGFAFKVNNADPVLHILKLGLYGSGKIGCTLSPQFEGCKPFKADDGSITYSGISITMAVESDENLCIGSSIKFSPQITGALKNAGLVLLVNELDEINEVDNDTDSDTNDTQYEIDTRDDYSLKMEWDGTNCGTKELVIGCKKVDDNLVLAYPEQTESDEYEFSVNVYLKGGSAAQQYRVPSAAGLKIPELIKAKQPQLAVFEIDDEKTISLNSTIKNETSENDKVPSPATATAVKENYADDTSGKAINVLAVKLLIENIHTLKIPFIIRVYHYDTEKGVELLTPQGINEVVTIDGSGPVELTIKTPPIQLDMTKLFITLSVDDTGVEKKGLALDRIINYSNRNFLPFEGTSVVSHLIATEVCSSEAAVFLTNVSGYTLLNDSRIQKVLSKSGVVPHEIQDLLKEILDGKYRPYKNKFDKGSARCVQRLLAFTGNLSGTIDGAFGNGSNTAYFSFLKSNNPYQLIDTDNRLVAAAVNASTTILISAIGFESLLTAVESSINALKPEEFNTKISSINKRDNA